MSNQAISQLQATDFITLEFRSQPLSIRQPADEKGIIWSEQIIETCELKANSLLSLNTGDQFLLNAENCLARFEMAIWTVTEASVAKGITTLVAKANLEEIAHLESEAAQNTFDICGPPRSPFGIVGL